MRTSREEDAQRELLYRDFSAEDLLYKLGPLPFISDARRGFLAPSAARVSGDYQPSSNADRIIEI